MTRWLAFFLALCLTSLAFPSSAFADEVWTPPIITPIQKGAPAPFTGILLTPEAVAKVIAEAKDCPKRVEVEAEKARAEEKARGDKALADLQADAKHDKTVLQAGIEQRDGMIKDLGLRLEKSEQARSNTIWYVGGGVLAGAALVILSVVAVGAAN